MSTHSLSGYIRPILACAMVLSGAVWAEAPAQAAPPGQATAEAFVEIIERLSRDANVREEVRATIASRLKAAAKQTADTTVETQALESRLEALTREIESVRAELEALTRKSTGADAQDLPILQRSLDILDALAPGSAAPAVSASTFTPEQADFFEKGVRGVLAQNCLGCHGPEKPKGGLRLDSLEELVKGGGRGPGIAPGDPDKSLLIAAIRQDGDLKMPPKGKLDQATIDTLTEWVKMGAPWPSQGAAPTAEKIEAPTPPQPTPAVVASAPTESERTIHYSRDIQHILSNNCFACHGPDDMTRKAGLRLDDGKGAFAPLASKATALVPGDRAKSELWSRVTSTDPNTKMPPADFGKTLTAQQIELLGRWIDEGAVYEKHWAFVAPTHPAPPAVQNMQWPRNDIDRFLLARMEKEGLSPREEADRPALIRRVTFDLTGLPPTPDEVKAFVEDQRPDAYERVVDRLLASPRYGEHVARYWLDLARYADTNGYHIDNERYMWRWRDWVIDAFNRNMPFDQFTIEQLAGDLLPNPTLEQRIASGFHRNHMITFEGGIIPEEYRTQYVVDRVNTTSTVWLGLTVNCAQCHDHKYDPISQKDFYRLFAFFNTVDEKGSDGNTGNSVPFIKAPTPDQAQKLAEYTTRLQEASARLNQPLPDLDAAQAQWEKDTAQSLASRWTALEPESVTSSGGAQMTCRPDHSVLVQGANADKDVYEVVARTDLTDITAFRLEALTDEALPEQGPGRFTNANFVLTEFEAEVASTAAPETFAKLTFRLANADHAQPEMGVDLAIDANAETGWGAEGFNRRETRTAVFVPDKSFGFPGGTIVKVRLRHESKFAQHGIGCFRLSVTADPLSAPARFDPWYLSGPYLAKDGPTAYATAYEPEQGVDLKATYSDQRAKWVSMPEFADAVENPLKGEAGANYVYRVIHSPNARTTTFSLGSNDSLKVWLNDVLVHENAASRSLQPDSDRVTVRLRPGENRLLMKIVNYGGKHGFFFRNVGEQVGAVPLDAEALLTKAPQERSEVDVARLRELYRSEHWEQWGPLSAELASIQQELRDFESTIPSTMVMAEMATPRDTFVLKRGQYDQPSEKVTAAVPAFLPQLPEGQPANRLALAQWLTAPNNPLVARVTVNRFWARFFGTGLVKTVEDFGVQGEWPIHPELLDWLATEFIRTGWDVKGLQRLIVTSAAYRQSSKLTPELLEKDPENRLLARGPRFRMDAEMLRDNALAVSGLLVEKLGGPSVKPYQPTGLWEEVSYGDPNFTAQTFVQDHGEALYRRSMYIFWKRQAPPPQMQVFDAPNREVCTARRARTNTPLQALAMLNDTQYVEAARVLAQRMMKEGGNSPEERVRYAFRLVTAREPKEHECAILVDTFTQQVEDYRKTPEEASKLLSVGEWPCDAALDPCELAAWTTVAGMLLNLDETVTKG